MVARCDGKPIVFIQSRHTHRQTVTRAKAGLLKPYVGAYTQLDFSLPCPSIFDTSEEIKEKYGIRAGTPTGTEDDGENSTRTEKVCAGQPGTVYCPMWVRGEERTGA